MKTTKWGWIGLGLFLLLNLSGCGTSSALTKGADEAQPTLSSSTQHILQSSSKEWTLIGGTNLYYYNLSQTPVTLTFQKTPISASLQYRLPTSNLPETMDIGVLAAIATYTIPAGHSMSWDIPEIQEHAQDVVLTLHLLGDTGDAIIREIHLDN